MFTLAVCRLEIVDSKRFWIAPKVLRSELTAVRAASTREIAVLALFTVLTVTEFLILETLAQRPGVVKTRNQLMDAAYQDDIYVDDRTIDSHIKRLRRKFRVVDPEFGAIETLYGAGYSFSDG